MEQLYLVNALLIAALCVEAVLTLIGLPGNFLLVITVLIYAFTDGFVHINYIILAALITALIVGEFIEFIAGAVTAKRKNASKRAIFAAVVGAVFGGVLGTVVIPVIGSLIGLLAGVYALSYLAEFSVTGNAESAGQVALSILKGQFAGVVVKFIIAIGMIVMVALNLPWSESIQ